MPRQLWPYEEARRILKTFPSAGTLTLETGYGPSGAPHIGTFAEVARTTWVGTAIKDLSGKEWDLVAFSDDMDGLRKVPLNMPADRLSPHLGKPLSNVPDPFDCHESYAAHNNGKLREMLDRFGFRYSFRSSHEMYTRGVFNDGLTRIMRNYEGVREVILPTIREGKRDDWSPFFPICTECGHINGTRVTGRDAEALTVSYVCEGDRSGAVGDDPDDAGAGLKGCGSKNTVSILDGHVKVGWKVDWALRWYALGVQYEMYGKDLIESAELSARICKVISGKKGPVQSFYEMFLDEEGRKISKSVGRGLTIDSWLSCAPEASLLLFILKEPRKAKRLSWDVVARSVDEYLQLLGKWYSTGGGPESVGQRDELGFVQPDLPESNPYEYPVSFSMLLGLIGAIGVPSPDVVIGYVHHYKGRIPGSDAMLEQMVRLATCYVKEQILPSRDAVVLNAKQRQLVVALADYLHPEGGEPTSDEAEEIQSKAFDIAREGEIEAREFFRLVYSVLTGQNSGPRLGSFVRLLGPEQVATQLRASGSD